MTRVRLLYSSFVLMVGLIALICISGFVELESTVEREEGDSIPFLDMKIIHKATDTGLTMNFHALAPIKYKRSVVSRIIYRIHCACSTWKNNLA